MQRFDIFVGDNEPPISAKQSADPPVANGHSANHSAAPSTETVSPSHSASPQKRSADEESSSEPTDKSQSSKKRKSDLVDADAIYAAKLQAEENLRARPTRGASTRKAAPAKKRKQLASKSKTGKKVKAEDDSDVDGSGSESKKEVNRTGGFHVS